MKNYLILGDYNAICDSCGRKFKASQLKKRWDGLMVCEEDYELRHPMDFLRVRKEKIAVDFSRPQSADVFVPSCTLETSSGIAGYAGAGCGLPSKKYSHPPIGLDYVPPYCTLTSIQPLADLAGADCATLGIIP